MGHQLQAARGAQAVSSALIDGFISGNRVADVHSSITQAHLMSGRPVRSAVIDPGIGNDGHSAASTDGHVPHRRPVGFHPCAARGGRA